jgi:RimJ/RimL family protein N-acetyltransferase
VSGLAALVEEMCSERASVEGFVAHSFGLCPVHESGALAGWCLSEYNTGDRCEVGIATLPPYQRLGLATPLGSAFVELAAARGVTRIGWHCFAGNAASVATALSIGFEKVDDYTAIIGWY